MPQRDLLLPQFSSFCLLMICLIIYIVVVFSVSDMTKSLQNETTSMFADDTVAICTSKTEELFLTSMKDIVDRLHSWLRVNRLKINLGKSNFVMFFLSSVLYPWIHEIVTHSGVLKRALSIKYLGVYIDDILSFKCNAFGLVHLLPWSSLYEFFKITLFVFRLECNLGIHTECP